MNGRDEQIDADARELWRAYAGCPDEVQLAAVIHGRADARTLAHVNGCPACAAAVSELRELLAGGPMVAPASVTDRAKSLVKVNRSAAVYRWQVRLSWSAAAMVTILAGWAGLHLGQAAGVMRVESMIAAHRAQMDHTALASRPASQPAISAVRELTGMSGSSVEVALFMEGAKR